MRHVDLCVIGSGSGNSIIDDRFADRSVALIDDGVLFGGTCLNHGCIPTKMFVRPASVIRSVAEAARVNITADQVVGDWAAVRDRVFGRIDPIAAAGEAWRAESEQVALYRTRARFTGPRTLAVGEETLTADAVVIAAGSRAVLPPVPGLAEAFADGVAHTSDTIMRLDRQPASMIILGSGFVAAEFGHVFSSFGTRVTVCLRGDRMLRHADRDISARFTTGISSAVSLVESFTATGVTSDAEGVVVRGTTAGGQELELGAACLLVAVGRIPNSDRLDVARAGVAVNEAGFIEVDAHQRTSAAGVWALGDICSPWMLKHVANREARTVAHNLLHPDDLRTTDHRAVPYAVFGHPEVASVGLTEDEARAAGHDIAVGMKPYSDTAAGWAREDTTSLAKVIADRRTGMILGAHIVGPQAASLIQPVVQAMATDVDAATLARVPYWIHPALTEVVENALLALDLPGQS
ncbi:MAG: mycothione reductase [Propioniciclava sp.]